MTSLVDFRGQASPHHLIKSPHITEKTTHAANRHNCFVIEVAVSAGKIEIKSAVEKAWDVRVVAVRTQMRAGTACRYKSKLGVSRQRKLALVTLHSDDRLGFI